MSERLQNCGIPLAFAGALLGAFALTGCEGNEDKGQNDIANSASASVAPVPPVNPKLPTANKYTATCNAPNYDRWGVAAHVINDEDKLRIIQEDLNVSEKDARSAKSGEASCDKTVNAADILHGSVSIVIKQAEGARCTAVDLLLKDQVRVDENQNVIVACIPSSVKTV